MSGGSQTQTTKQSPWAPAVPYLKSGLGQAADLYNSGGMTIDYSGDWVADMTPEQLAALQGITGTVGAQNGQLGQVAGGLMGLATGQQQNDNWDTIARDTIERLMPGINSSFAGSGMTGSTLHQQNLSKGLSEGLASAHVDHTNNAIQQQFGAASSLGGVLGQVLGNSQAGYDAATALQTQEQNELDSQYQNSLLGQNADYEALSQYLAMISGIGGMGGTSTQTSSARPGVGGILGAVSSIGSLFSDQRLKTDIKRVGQTDSGLGVYTYRYKGSDTVHMGVMAHEVAEVLPHAVSTEAGFSKVNYGAL